MATKLRRSSVFAVVSQSAGSVSQLKSPKWESWTAKYEDFADLKAWAAALAEDGQFAKAIQWQEKVVERSGERQRAAERNILRQYRSQEPLRFTPLDA